MAPVGKPVTVMVTFPVNEFTGVMVKGNFALVPALIVSTLVFAAIEKSGATTTKATDVVCESVPSLPVMVRL